MRTWRSKGLEIRPTLRGQFPGDADSAAPAGQFRVEPDRGGSPPGTAASARLTATHIPDAGLPILGDPDEGGSDNPTSRSKGDDVTAEAD